MDVKRIAVIIATRNQAKMAAALVARLNSQTLQPDQIFVVGATPPDIALLPKDQRDLTACVAPAEVSALRNHGVRLAGNQYDYLVFFDADFLPSRHWIERAFAHFESSLDVTAMSGLVLTSGRAALGVDIDSPAMIVAMLDDASRGRPRFTATPDLDGGNLAVRRSALEGLALDGKPTLGGGLNNLDLGVKLAERGRVGQLSALFGMKNNADHPLRKGELVPAPAHGQTAGSSLLNALHLIQLLQSIDRLICDIKARLDLLAGKTGVGRVI